MANVTSSAASAELELQEGRMGAAPADGSQIVSLAARDLGVIHTEQTGSQVFPSSHVQDHLVAVRQPIQIAPSFAAIDLLGRRAFGSSRNARVTDANTPMCVSCWSAGLWV